MKILSVKNRQELEDQLGIGNHLVVLFGMNLQELPKTNVVIDQATQSTSDYDALLVNVDENSELADEFNVHHTIHYAIYRHQQLIRQLIIPSLDVQTLKTFMNTHTECVFG